MLTRRHWVKNTTATLVSASLGASLASATTLQQQAPALRTLHIKNLHCEGCAKRLRASIYKVAGVLSVKTDVKNGIAVITPTQNGSPVAKDLWVAAETQKFQVAKLVTPVGTFKQKPQ